MNKYFLLCLFSCVICLSQAAFAQTPQPTPPPIVDESDEEIKVSTVLIQVDVVVTDKKKNQVRNLKPEDFEIYENGERQEISSVTYISSKSKNAAVFAQDDSLELAGNKGTTLKDKIGIPKTGRSIDSNNIRRTFVLVVDNLGLNFASVKLVKESLRSFVDEQIRDGDIATIVTTSGSRVIPSFTSNKKELHAIIKKLKWSPQSRGGADSYEPIRTTFLEDLSDMAGQDLPGTREEAALLEDIERLRNNNSAAGSIGSLNYIVNGMQNLPGRKALVLFSEGFALGDRTSEDPSTNNAESDDPAGYSPSMSNRFSSGSGDALASLIETANRSSVVIYSIDPRGLQNLSMANADDDIRQAFGRNFKPGQTGNKRTARDDYFKQTQEGLRVLSSETGGFAVLNTNNLEKGLDRIVDDQSYYLISYITALETVNSAADVIEKVEIKVNKPDLEVRYRSTFYSPESKSNSGFVPKTPREKIGQALAYPFKANEIKLNLYPITGNDAAGDSIRFLINISAEDLKFEREANNNRKANFDMLALTLDVDGKPVHQFVKNFSITVNEPTYKNILKRGFVYVLPVPLKKSGAYHFRVAIRDSKTGKVGAAATFQETPKFEKKKLWISSMVLASVSNDKTKPAETEYDNTVFTDSTLREFGLPISLSYSAVVYNAVTKGADSPELEIQTRLIRDDKVVSETPFESLSTKNQKDLQRIDVSGVVKFTNSLQPGNYILQIVVVDKLAKEKSQTATQWIDFEILN